MTSGTGTVRTFGFERFLAIAVSWVFALTAMMGLLQPAPKNVTPPPPVQTEGRAIGRVIFEGLKTVDSGYLQGVVRIKPGAIWNRDEIAGACARLAETGKFEGSPYAVARDEEGQLVLVFVVKERPFVTEVTITGNKKFKVDELLKAVEISSGSPISEYTIGQAKLAIERKYKEAGYAQVSVTVDDAALQQEQRVVLTISEGPRIKVRHIRFEGNLNYTANKLRSKIETTTYIWLFRTGAFDDETAQRDASAIKQFYIDRGYLNAQVGYKIDIANQSDLTLTFVIEEGVQHIIKKLNFVGNVVLDNDRVASIMEKTRVDAPLDADNLKADCEKLRNEYGRTGYIYAEVVPRHVFDVEDGFVDVTITITEKEQYRFGRIEVRGNRTTRDKVVRRELRFYPEDLYNKVATKEAEKRLTETRLFKEATITPQGEMPGVRDALVDVTEANSGNVMFGVGITSNNGLVGSITLEQKNFDLFDWPRNGSELFKGKAFHGAGQTMRLQIEPGTQLNRGRIDFREPYLFDQDLGLGVGAYLFERKRHEYKEERAGTYVSLDRRFKEGILKNWAAEIATRLEYIDIKDVDWYEARDIQKAKGSSWLTSLKGSLVHDMTDSIWLPTKGDRLKLSWEQAGVFGGDWTFSKLIADYNKYFTLYTDTFDRKHILSLGGTIGQIFGDAPVFERFYAGGSGSIRGFEFRGISPRQGWANDRVGGDFELLTNAEYSFPLVGEVLRGVTFLDMGTVESDFGLHSWRAAVGVGARIYIKYFGPVPLSFDLAVPIAKDSDDDTQIFNFAFGTTF